MAKKGRFIVEVDLDGSYVLTEEKSRKMRKSNCLSVLLT
jgi:hypothetical protein